MIREYAQHGNNNEALEILEQMQQYGMKPNHITLDCHFSNKILLSTGFTFYYTTLYPMGVDQQFLEEDTSHDYL